MTLLTIKLCLFRFNTENMTNFFYIRSKIGIEVSFDGIIIFLDESRGYTGFISVATLPPLLLKFPCVCDNTKTDQIFISILVCMLRVAKGRFIF